MDIIFKARDVAERMNKLQVAGLKCVSLTTIALVRYMVLQVCAPALTQIKMDQASVMDLMGKEVIDCKFIKTHTGDRFLIVILMKLTLIMHKILKIVVS